MFKSIYLEHNLPLDWLVAGVAVVGHIQVIIIHQDSSVVWYGSPVLVFTHGSILGKFSISWRDVRILRREIRIRVHLNEHCIALTKTNFVKYYLKAIINKCQITSKYCLIHDCSERVVRGRVQRVAPGPGLLAGGRGQGRHRGCLHRDGRGAGADCLAHTLA